MDSAISSSVRTSPRVGNIFHGPEDIWLLAGADIIADDLTAALRRHRVCRGNAYGPHVGPPCRFLQDVPNNVRNRIGAQAAGRCRVKKFSGDRRAVVGSATSISGESAREMAFSQSSICMVPSGRSAMICTVHTASPEIRIRTSGTPCPSRTGLPLPIRVPPRLAQPLGVVRPAGRLARRYRCVTDRSYSVRSALRGGLRRIIAMGAMGPER